MTRLSGLYLARMGEGSELEVVSFDSKYPTEVYTMGWDIKDSISDYFWVSDKPLDLDKILQLQGETK